MKKLNILDLIIIFVIIFVLAFGVCRIFFFGKSSGSDNAKNASKIISDKAVATTTFEIKKLKNIAADAILEGVACYDDKGNYMGEIKEVTKKVYYEYNVNEYNKFVKSTFHDRITVNFKVDVPGRATYSGFVCQDMKHLGVGAIKYVVVNGIKLEAAVSDIEVSY